MSHFCERLEAGRFVISTEMEPPKGTDLSHLLSTIQLLKGKVHAANVTDNQKGLKPLCHGIHLMVVGKEKNFKILSELSLLL